MIVQSRASCPAVFVPLEEWNDGDGHPPGAFTVETWACGQRAMLYNCASDGSECLLRLRPCTAIPSWEFNGDTSRPTLSPSVDRQYTRRDGTKGSIWHGWLSDGEWKSC